MNTTYNARRIAWELERTALGDGYFGNALRVAKDVPGITAEDRGLLDRWATGNQGGTDHITLQGLALRIDQAGDDPSPPFDDGGPVHPTPGAANEPGLSLRDHFAALAMQADISALPSSGDADPYVYQANEIAADAYQMADAMIVARKRRIIA